MTKPIESFDDTVKRVTTLMAHTMPIELADPRLRDFVTGVFDSAEHYLPTPDFDYLGSEKPKDGETDDILEWQFHNAMMSIWFLTSIIFKHCPPEVVNQLVERHQPM